MIHSIAYTLQGLLKSDQYLASPCWSKILWLRSWSMPHENCLGSNSDRNRTLDALWHLQYLDRYDFLRLGLRNWSQIVSISLNARASQRNYCRCETRDKIRQTPNTKFSLLRHTIDNVFHLSAHQGNSLCNVHSFCPCCDVPAGNCVCLKENNNQ